MDYLNVIGTVVTGVKDTFDELFTSDEERLRAELEFKKLDLEKYKDFALESPDLVQCKTCCRM